MWVLRTLAVDGTTHQTATTLVECQAACEFDPHCVAVSWRSSYQECLISTNPNHTHTGSTDPRWQHYDLVSRCSITSGQSVF